MANTKKSVSKKTSGSKTGAQKKAAPAAKKKAQKKGAQPALLLSSEQRRRVLKPREGYEELIERVARTWENIKSLRVPGLTVARLRKLVKDADFATQKEAAMREKMERMLRPLNDKRLLAGEKAWRGLLDVNAAVKLFARSDPSLADTFGFLTDALGSSPGSAKSAAPSHEASAERNEGSSKDA